MAILEIRIVPDPILKIKAHKIKKIDDSIKTLALDMFETLQDAHGVGLAANQVGVLKRVIVISNAPESDIVAYINPEITNRKGKRSVSEGCLSFPGYSGIVTRSISVSARYIDEAGGKIKITASDLLSQALEHEIDHLNGILFIDYLSKLKKDMIIKKLVKQKKGIERVIV